MAPQRLVRCLNENGEPSGETDICPMPVLQESLFRQTSTTQTSPGLSKDVSPVFLATMRYLFSFTSFHFSWLASLDKQDVGVPLLIVCQYFKHSAAEKLYPSLTSKIHERVISST